MIKEILNQIITAKLKTGIGSFITYSLKKLIVASHEIYLIRKSMIVKDGKRMASKLYQKKKEIR